MTRFASANAFPRLFALLAALLVAFLVTWAPLALAQPPCPGQYAALQSQPKPQYFVKGDPKHPVTFSYEIEFNLADNPKILNYYRPGNYSDEAWLKLPLQKRIEITQGVITGKVLHKETVLTRMSNAPDFLAKKITTEVFSDLELAKNEISGDLSAIFSHLDWFVENIGPASLQGHAAFRSTEIKGAANYIHLDYDVSQAEALRRGYNAYVENGRTPGPNISHAALGPLTDKIAAKNRSRLGGGAPRSALRVDNESKLFFGNAFRPDLYGWGNVGFEVRHCHRNLACLKAKMQELAEELERGFQRYAETSEPEVAGKKVFARQPDFVKRVLERVGLQVEVENEASRFLPLHLEYRYLFPLLDWKAHPYIRALQAEEAANFLQKEQRATQAFLDELKRLDRPDANLKETEKAVRVAMAKWVAETELDTKLAQGKSALMAGPAPLQRHPQRLKLVKESDPILHRPAAPLTAEEITNPETQLLIDNLVETMNEKGGVGIAAPQVGVSKKIAVFKRGDEEVVLVNPKITALSPETTRTLEGCLSVSLACGFVDRFKNIRVDYLDRTGKPNSLVLKGYDAIVAQHEADHLEGILFTDRFKTIGLRPEKGVRKAVGTRDEAMKREIERQMKWWSKGSEPPPHPSESQKQELVNRLSAQPWMKSEKERVKFIEQAQRLLFTVKDESGAERSTIEAIVRADGDNGIPGGVDSDTLKRFYHFWRAAGDDLFAEILSVEYPNRLLKRFFQLTGNDREDLVKILRVTGIRTREQTLLGGQIRRALENLDVSRLRLVLEHARKNQVPPEEVASLLTMMQNGFPKGLSAEGDLSMAFKLLREGAGDESVLHWAQKLVAHGSDNSKDTEFLLEILPRSATSLESLSMTETLARIGDKECLLKVHPDGRSVKVKPVDEALRPRIAELREKRAREFESNKVRVGRFDMIKILDKRNEGVSILGMGSGPLWHYSIVIDGTLYDVMGNKGIRRSLAGTFVKTHEFGNHTLIDLNVTAEEKARLRASLDAALGKPVNFDVLNMSVNSVNCTSGMVCHLDAAGIMKIGDEPPPSDAKQAIKSLVKSAQTNPRIARVHMSSASLETEIVVNGVSAIMLPIFYLTANPYVFFGTVGGGATLAFLNNKWEKDKRKKREELEADFSTLRYKIDKDASKAIYLLRRGRDAAQFEDNIAQKYPGFLEIANRYLEAGGDLGFLINDAHWAEGLYRSKLVADLEALRESKKRK